MAVKILGNVEEGCIKVYQSHSSLQRHLDVGKHLLALERELTKYVIKKKWAETCKSISGSYMRAAHLSTSGSASVSLSQSEDTPATADIGLGTKKRPRSRCISPPKYANFCVKSSCKERKLGTKERLRMQQHE